MTYPQTSWHCKEHQVQGNRLRNNPPPSEGFERSENSPADCFQRERADRPWGKGTDVVGDGVVRYERQPVDLTTPALRATPPKEGDYFVSDCPELDALCSAMKFADMS
jgi:hypothetical protein